MSKYNNTIYALATPTGRSAIAVIRLSGDNVLKILTKISSIKKIIPNQTKVTVFKYKKEENDSAPIFIPGNTERFLSSPDSSNIRCDDDHVMCQSPWRCVNGSCEPCTEVKLVTKCVEVKDSSNQTQCSFVEECAHRINNNLPK